VLIIVEHGPTSSDLTLLCDAAADGMPAAL